MSEPEPDERGTEQGSAASSNIMTGGEVTEKGVVGGRLPEKKETFSEQEARVSN